LLNHSFSYRLTGSLPARASEQAEPGGTESGPCQTSPLVTAVTADAAVDRPRAPKNPLPDSRTGVVNAGRSPQVRGLRRGWIGCPVSCRGLLGADTAVCGRQLSCYRSRVRARLVPVTPVRTDPACVLALPPSRLVAPTGFPAGTCPRLEVHTPTQHHRACCAPAGAALEAPSRALGRHWA